MSKPKPAVAPAIASIELNRDRLAHVRVMQKNLVFVVGLSTQIAQEQVLRRTEYFGMYNFKITVFQFQGLTLVIPYISCTFPYFPRRIRLFIEVTLYWRP